MLKSTDSGNNWQPANTGLPTAPVNALAIDPSMPSTLYATVAYWGVYRSTDGGDSWQLAPIPPPEGPTPTPAPNTGLPVGGLLAIDPTAPSTLYAGTASFSISAGIVKSTDGATTWRAVGGLDYGPVYAIAVDPATPGTLYVSTGSGGGVFKSTDGARSWQAVNSGLPLRVLVDRLAIDPTTPGTLYAGLSYTAHVDGQRPAGGVFKSTDGGGTWNATGLTGDPICGDGVQCRSEECDDGNVIDGDGCDSNCTVTRCGNAVVTAGEECDDGNFDPSDGCTNACTICGNGIVNAAGEQCDDGNRNNNDGCTNACVVNVCGDGFPNPATEECDNGSGNPNPIDGCTYACTICGNGIVTPPEGCDDGNLVNGDGCEADCTLPRCGNGIVDVGEECDDGNLVNGDACDANCTLPRCGNGIVDSGEECDDGNPVNGDACDANCTAPQCGNGIVDPGEQCDDGNRNPFDGCTNHCTRCGDGIVTPPEECDDGNTDPSDGCTNACTRCGNGAITAPETCDVGSPVTGNDCDPSCQTVCGNGVVGGDEECDDGGLCIGSTNAGTHCIANADCPAGHCQTFGGDGCAANCTLETQVVFNLVTGVLQQGNVLAPGTSGASLFSDYLGGLPLALGGRQTLTIGKQRNGQIPVVVNAATVRLASVAAPFGFGCFCQRAVAAKTCGGTVLEPDGVTPSLDCTPGFTAGESLCQGKKPCTFVHGPGNSASGVIGCDGLDGVNVRLTRDAGGSSGTASPPAILVNGTGGSGAAVLSATSALGGPVYPCTGPEYVYGPDGEFCTDDDPQEERGIPATAPLTTGTASAELLNVFRSPITGIGGSGADAGGIDIGPFAVTGAPFRCNGLEVVPGDASNAGLASAFTQINQPPFGYLIFTSVLVASSCAGDCDSSRAVTIDEIITLVNMALGNAQPAACAHGVPTGAEVDIALLIRAVNNALSGCFAVPPTPTVTLTPTRTPTPTITPTPSVTPTATITPTPTSTVTGTPPTFTPTLKPRDTPTAANTEGPGRR